MARRMSMNSMPYTAHSLRSSDIQCLRDGCPLNNISPLLTDRDMGHNGKLYAALGKRSGRVVASDLQSGSASFRVRALMPVAESFRFALELRTHTSGLAAPQMMFSHWEVIDIDPFWRPRTEEEYLHWGEKWDGVNRAKAYMDAVRTRKGLATDRQLVTHAEKQRTLSKKK
ncbi:unnamed protein product [Colias eurytheme]|nr:unnamed protein product [Colias eurytheme]